MITSTFHRQIAKAEELLGIDRKTLYRLLKGGMIFPPVRHAHACFSSMTAAFCTL